MPDSKDRHAREYTAAQTDRQTDKQTDRQFAAKDSYNLPSGANHLLTMPVNEYC